VQAHAGAAGVKRPSAAGRSQKRADEEKKDWKRQQQRLLKQRSR
jgi:hypothetical protein